MECTCRVYTFYINNCNNLGMNDCRRPSVIDLKEVEWEVRFVEQYLQGLNIPTANTHNDFHNFNVLYDEKSGKGCQMLSWWMKNSLHSITICDIITKVFPLCSVYQAPSYEPNPTLLAWFLPDFAYGSADHLENSVLSWITL